MSTVAVPAGQTTCAPSQSGGGPPHFEKPNPRLRRLSSKTQARLDTLMSKNNEGQLTAAERKEFVILADQAHRMSLENARTLLAERQRAGSRGAVRKKSTVS